MEIIKDKEIQITTGEEPRIYFVIDEDRDCVRNILCKDKEEANREARARWEGLTYDDKKCHSIYVAYTKRTSSYYSHIGEDWDPCSFHSYSTDDDDFTSDHYLDYHYYSCDFDFVMFDGVHAVKNVIDYDDMRYYFENPGAYDSIDEMIIEIREHLEYEIAKNFPGNDEDRVEDVIDSILNTVDALLINNLWYHDFEAGKYKEED